MPRQISFGIPVYPWQSLDVIGPIDILSNADFEMINIISSAEAERLSPPHFTFHWVGSSLDETVKVATGNVHMRATTTFATCPPLDYLLLGGPFPDFALDLPADLKAFIVERSSEVNTIFSTCTGGAVLAATGLLTGVHATMNHLMVKVGKQISPTTKWDNTKHWIIDKKGNTSYWTAAGAGAGMDMFAFWIRQEFGQEVLNYSTSTLEWCPRDVDGKSLMHMNGRREVV